MKRFRPFRIAPARCRCAYASEREQPSAAITSLARTKRVIAFSASSRRSTFAVTARERSAGSACVDGGLADWALAAADFVASASRIAGTRSGTSAEASAPSAAVSVVLGVPIGASATGCGPGGSGDLSDDCSGAAARAALRARGSRFGVRRGDNVRAGPLLSTVRSCSRVSSRARSARSLALGPVRRFHEAMVRPLGPSTLR